MTLNFAPKSMFIIKDPLKSASLISGVWLATHSGFNPQRLTYSLVHHSTLFSSRNFEWHRLKLVRHAQFNGFSDGADVHPFDDANTNANDEQRMDSSLQVELLDPNLLGIWPDWLEKDKVCQISIEQKANSFGIPHSLQMIKRKQRWKDGFVDAGEFAYCSVKKAFSSLVLIIRELQSYTLVIKEGLNCEDLIDLMNKMQRDMTITFVWLFQQVFSTTPTLMVYVMLLLANYSVHSMTNKAFIGVFPYPRLYENVVVAEIDELGLWKSMVVEASRMQGGVDYKVMVSPLNMRLKLDDNHGMCLRMNLIYQMRIAEEPYNPFLLSNYAQFLSFVIKNHDRAEEYFKRAVRVEPQEVEALELYAEFLWKVRNDLPEAEEWYLQATAVDIENPFRASKYANFLRSTGGEETCYPLR
ncbi:hypothetical protein ES319_A10G256600v1 [Gossypium barbadense]|uniref:Uncharacterized protein n=1 Tax=Gossypium barbadense TaxID=3634 RepID=A0A2P5YSS4_GOSBA|nr:hypothetical protein ES319_A10G256600v1 [Gossypium barbadense]PPS18622.1 hypothetical protein GOBAR_AA01924 [Gossypium barbadense]